MKGSPVRVRWPDGLPELRLAAAARTFRSLAAQLAASGRPLNTRCGQRGICAGCTVKLVAGAFRHENGDVIAAPADVKACQGQALAGSGTVVEVPARSVVVHQPQVATTFKVNVASAQDPIVRYSAGACSHGLAIDVGTTTVVVALVDLASGEIVGEASGFNRQIEMGEDVITRIQLAGSPGQLQSLHRAIVESTLMPLVHDVCRDNGVAPGRLGCATVAGNTTMLHLLTRTDPTPMGFSPFRAPFLGHRALRAADLGLGVVPPAMPVHLLPGFSAYVGADLVAGSLCTGLMDEPGPSLLVDIGTNGEILLRRGENLYATATAAGPAFEGGRLECGTRAVAGAVEHVTLPGGVFPAVVDVVPGKPQAAGLCGSAYVDFLAEARRCGLIGAQGRLEPTAWAGVPQAHRHEVGANRGIRLRPGDPTTVVTEADIAHLLQAKAAIAAGIQMLLRRARCEPGAVRKLYLAGGFGLHLNVSNAIACGLLPGFSPKQVDVVGNTSLGGAWLALVDSTVLPEMSQASTRAEVVELNLEPGFEEAFIDQLSLP